MHNPPHPGEVIREQPLGVTVIDAAKALGISRKALSELLNGHTGISPEMESVPFISFISCKKEKNKGVTGRIDKLSNAVIV